MSRNFTCPKVSARVGRVIPSPLATDKKSTVLPPLVRGRETPDKTHLLLITRDFNLSRVGHTFRDPVFHRGVLKVISTSMTRLPQNVEVANLTRRR